MKLLFNPHKIQISEQEAVNEKEIDISECEFEFADEITDDFVKEAYFTIGNETYKQIIVNNKCTFPQEVLVKPATIELGAVAYLVEDNTEIKRYNPTPVYFKTDLGSLKTAQNSQPITPSELEQYEQALQDGLSEVDGKLDAMNTALAQVDNLDIDAINWLSEFIINYPNCVIVVSHDRHFLNNVCTHIVDIDYKGIKI